MPYKLKESVRHKFSKASYRLKNWSAYNASLKARGSLTIWFSEEAIAAWNTPVSSGRRGRRKRYSDIAITTSLSLKLVYRLGLRQTEGLISSIIALMGINLRSPDYTTLSRRSSLVEVKKLYPRNTSDGVVIMIDSTGLKLYGEKEWCVHKHGGNSLRRSWRKLHLSIDDTGHIHSSELTTLHESDDSQVSPLLDAVTVPIVKIIADGGYNTTTVESYVRERAPENKPDIVIPPNKNTKLSSLDQPSIQDQHIIAIREQGRQRWQKETGYNRRSKVENAMYRYKTIIGRKMSARTIETQKTESKIAVFVLNTMTALGMPVATKTA